MGAANPLAPKRELRGSDQMDKSRLLSEIKMKRMRSGIGLDPAPKIEARSQSFIKTELRQILIRWEIPRLGRGGSKSLTKEGVHRGNCLT